MDLSKVQVDKHPHLQEFTALHADFWYHDDTDGRRRRCWPCGVADTEAGALDDLERQMSGGPANFLGEPVATP